MSLHEEEIRQQNREAYLQSEVNELWRTIPEGSKAKKSKRKKRFPKEPQENILYFIEKHAPLLKPWQRELVRIVRIIAQYFYPQKQTKVMNEGWASFWHYTLLNALYEEKLVTDEFMIEVLQNHTNVIMQPDFSSPYFNGINPYALGFRMMQDIRRYSENPTEEDKLCFPSLVNTDWISTLNTAMRDFKDESFIGQYLSPTVIRDLKLFEIVDDSQHPDILVDAIHDESGYGEIKDALSKQYNLGQLEPDIQVYSIDMEGDRTMTLHYTQQNNVPLGKTTQEVMKHLYTLWQFPITLKAVDEKGNVTAEYHCPEKSKKSSSLIKKD